MEIRHQGNISGSQLNGGIDRQINDLAAACAHDVRMGIDIAVEMLLPCHYAQRADQTGCLQLTEIAIDRAEAETGIRRLQLAVYPFSRRVNGRAAQTF